MTTLLAAEAKVAPDETTGDVPDLHKAADLTTTAKRMAMAILTASAVAGYIFLFAIGAVTAPGELIAGRLQPLQALA